MPIIKVEEGLAYVEFLRIGMKKTKNRPEQLHLDLQWEYLNRVTKYSENLAYYEAASQALLKPQATPALRSPLWEEIANARY